MKVRKRISVYTLALVMAVVLTIVVATGNDTVTAAGSGTTYYVDDVNGKDSNNGTSTSSAWQSITKVNATTFQAGDKVLLKAGGSWNGTLHPKGSGSINNPITLDMYGNGDKPHVEGNGALATVMLDGQDHWTIQNLEVTNNAPQRAIRHGIYVSGKTSGITSGIKIIDCYVHDVDGENRRGLAAPNSMYYNAAIYINQDGRSTATKHFDDILIDGCVVDDVLTCGIKVNQEVDSVIDQYHTNVIVRNSTISKVGTDGMILQNCVAPLAEYILCYDAGYNGNYSDTWLIAGLWTCGTQDATFQYNEVARTRLFNGDGTAFDVDWGTGGTFLFQYNYTHGNEGGVHLNCAYISSDPDYEKTILRYNVSVDDELYVVRADNTWDVELYNNVFYKSSGNLNLGNSYDYRYYNNVFNFQTSPSWGSKTVFDNNAYYPISAPSSDLNAITANPQFVNPGVVGDGRSFADNYQIASTSPLVDAGRVIENNGGLDFWGNTVSGIPDIGAHDAAPGPAVPVVNDDDFSDDFSDGIADGWTTYGGTWSVVNEEYKVTSGSGFKALVNNKSYSDFVLETDVKVVNDTSWSDAGTIFRVSNPTLGADNFRGYAATLSADRNKVILSKFNNNWQLVDETSMTINKNQSYDLRVEAVGSSIKVYVDDVLKIDATDTTWSSGGIGVRTYNTEAYFDTISVTKDLTFIAFNDDFDDGNDDGWTTYGGTWSVINNEYKVISGDGYKSIADNMNYTDFTYTANVKVINDSSWSDAGLMFRVTNPTLGADNFNGYAATLSADRNKVLLAKFSNNWQSIAETSMILDPNTFYELKVLAVGDSIKVYVDNVIKIDTTDSTWSSGGVGLRTYRTDAYFDTVSVTE